MLSIVYAVEIVIFLQHFRLRTSGIVEHFVTKP